MHLQHGAGEVRRHGALVGREDYWTAVGGICLRCICSTARAEGGGTVLSCGGSWLPCCGPPLAESKSAGLRCPS